MRTANPAREFKNGREYAKFAEARINELLPRLLARGYEFEEAFDLAYRKLGQEIGMTRIEIARAYVKFREHDRAKGRARILNR